MGKHLYSDWFSFVTRSEKKRMMPSLQALLHIQEVLQVSLGDCKGRAQVLGNMRHALDDAQKPLCHVHDVITEVCWCRVLQSR